MPFSIHFGVTGNVRTPSQHQEFPKGGVSASDRQSRNTSAVGAEGFGVPTKEQHLTKQYRVCMYIDAPGASSSASVDIVCSNSF